MTDRELLEAAAKAAGIELRFSAGFEDELSPRTWPALELWNPLTDDGDALRLAVKLKMRVSVGQVDWVGNEYGGAFAELGEIETDPYAATRRAIVRAAAEMGK